ncbi:MAG: 50S ribosomal protein L18 [Dehalococcoidales bacterium]|nr:50S ribosomal protein L18 [Dehalococcoidales bacterium]MDZ4230956.1 50S ribosomal protein L18 [Dehalococcoidales bacterium]
MTRDEPRVARRRRHIRVRAKVKGTPPQPRLCIFRSLKHVYAQVIDDTQGQTLTSASTLDQEIREAAAGKSRTDKAELVGALIARRALSKGINRIAFDRGGYQYHGNIKAMADAARKGGLKF